MRLSVRYKWTLALLLVGALPLGLLSHQTLRLQHAGLEGVERQLEAAVLARTSDGIERQLAQVAEATHRIGQLLTEPSIRDPEARLQLAREALARAETLAQVAIYDQQGGYIDTLYRRGEPLAEFPRTIAPPPQGGVWQPVDGGLRYVEAVERGGQRRSLVVGVASAARIHELLQTQSRIHFDARADGLVLTDATGRVISGAGFAPGEPLAHRDVFSQLPEPAKCLQNPSDLVLHFQAANGDAMLGAIHPLSTYPLILAARRPQATVYASLRLASRALYGSVLALAVLAAALGTFLGTRAARPIRSLVALSAAYAQRQFHRRSAVRTGDELEDLGRALDRMADELSRGEAELRRREQVETNLARYLPQGVAAAIASGSQSIRFGGQRRPVTVLFADLVSFTTYAEQSEPEQVVAFLNELFTILTDIVFEMGGTVDKFIGDAIMVLFGATADLPDGPQRALNTAQRFHRAVKEHATAWAVKYNLNAQLSIGIHHGEVVVGNLGSTRRMEYTAIGDAINTAARLQSLARGGETLLSRAVAEYADPSIELALVGEKVLRGRRQPLTIYSLK